MSQRIEMTAIIGAKPGKENELEEELKALEAKTLEEKGCIEFRIFKDRDSNNKFILWEIFEDSEAMKDHMEKDYTLRYFSNNLVLSTDVIKHTKI
ncbi:MAG: antibiotic biosynthesis monooxygenase [Gammaproteobacteria bacterium]|nr:antibiotic biosynthesis monooxygenase [Gammaproteobacteria bacterium]MDH5731689.1 antibiotic biosynthesis monooxygenase [Gammaproteobacteria bacterium]